MRVLFDYQAFELQSIGGVSRSYAELISHLRTNNCDCILGLKESDNIYLREKGLASRIKPLHYKHKRLFKSKKLFAGQRTLTRKVLRWMGDTNDCLQVNKDYCVKLLKKQQFDIFEPTFFDSYFLPYLENKPFVLTVHDMIPELFPQYYAEDDFQVLKKRELCPLADHIHVPSERTKNDLIGILNVDPGKITVIPHGGPMVFPDEQIERRIFDFPYLLYVGDRHWYKNFAPFLCECAKVIHDYKEICLVCTGPVFNDDEKKMIADLHLENNVIHFFADQESFGSLYHNALAFVYPSLYEGFGMPILEAFAFGCPVMLNNASCFPEVGGDAAVYFEMNDIETDFYEKFQWLYAMSSEDKAELIEKGKARLQKFSWDNSARKLMDLYNSLL